AGSAAAPVLADLAGHERLQRVDLLLHRGGNVRPDALGDRLDALGHGAGLRRRVLDDALTGNKPAATLGGLLMLGLQGALVLLEPARDIGAGLRVREHLGRRGDNVSHDLLLSWRRPATRRRAASSPRARPG